MSGRSRIFGLSDRQAHADKRASITSPKTSRGNKQASAQLFRGLMLECVSHKLQEFTAVPETSWCDKLASTPGVGLTLDWSYLPSSYYQQAMMPVTAKMVENDVQGFNIEHLDPYSFAFTSNDGFHYAFNSSRIFVEYRHRLKYVPQSAGPPIAELVSKPLPYTKLLSQITERLTAAAQLVCGSGHRVLRRAGIISSTTVSQDDIPPGIRRYLQYMSKPWGRPANTYNISVVSDVAVSGKSAWTDKCEHAVAKADTEEALINIRLDYNRSYDPEQNLNLPQLDGMLKNLRSSALAYFEDIAQGERFDDNIGNSAAD